MRKNGFSLIEILIVVAIVGILAAVALPAYNSHVETSNRVDAQISMAEMAQIFERSFARQGEYPVDLPSVSTPTSYKFTLTRATDSFTITATPLGSQRDEACGTMTINQAGALTAAHNDCWG